MSFKNLNSNYGARLLCNYHNNFCVIKNGDMHLVGTSIWSAGHHEFETSPGSSVCFYWPLWTLHFRSFIWAKQTVGVITEEIYLVLKFTKKKKKLCSCLPQQETKADVMSSGCLHNILNKCNTFSRARPLCSVYYLSLTTNKTKKRNTFLKHQVKKSYLLFIYLLQVVLERRSGNRWGDCVQTRALYAPSTWRILFAKR